MSIPNTNISLGAPPLLWSDVHEALTKVNENFTSLDLATGGSAVNLEDLYTSVSPSTTSTYSLGTDSKRWKNVHLGEYLDSPGNDDNGVYLGSAQIKGISGVVELPTGSTVNGKLIIDPTKTFFKSVQVDNGNQVVANSFSDTLNLNSGTAVQLIVDSSAESITINNTGVTSLVSGTAISISASTGAVTVSNTGVTSLAGSSPIVGRAAGAGISVSGSTGNITLTNTGLLGVQAGFGITISNDSASGISQISFNPTAAPQTGFTSIAIPGQTSITSDTTSDTLNFNAGYGIILTTTESTDTVTVTLNKNIDINGSVFGDDSSVLVDGVDSRIVGPVYTSTLRTSEQEIALGDNAGLTNQGSETVAIGWGAGQTNQGVRGIGIGRAAGQTDQAAGAIAIGNDAGKTTQGTGAVAVGYNAAVTTQGISGVAVGFSAGISNQGDYSIAIGQFAGATDQADNSIVLDATGGTGFPVTTTGFYVAPIRSTANGTPLMYNSSTKELFYSTVLEFVGSTISTSDSSGLSVDVLTTFNSDVNVENELRVRGSLMISVEQLKSIAAASADFTAFKTAIAALTA